MGLKSKVKKAKKKATGAVKTVQKKTQKVANVPVVRTAVTAVATTVAGPQGAQAVDQAYTVLNNSNPMDLLIGSVAPGYTVTKGYINQFKDQYSAQYKDQYSALSTVLPSSVNKASKSLVYGVSKVSTKVRKKSFIDKIFEFFGF